MNLQLSAAGPRRETPSGDAPRRYPPHLLRGKLKMMLMDGSCIGSSTPPEFQIAHARALHASQDARASHHAASAAHRGGPVRLFSRHQVRHAKVFGLNEAKDCSSDVPGSIIPYILDI